MIDPATPSSFTRREFIGAALAVAGSALAVGILWLAARGAPSATRDPALTPPVLAPTQTPPTTATPAPPAIS